MAGWNDKLKNLTSVVDVFKELHKYGDGFEDSMKNAQKSVQATAKDAAAIAGKEGAQNGVGTSVMSSPGIPPVIGANGMPTQPHVGGPAAAPQVTNPGSKGPGGMPEQPQVKVNPGAVANDPNEGWKRGPFGEVNKVPFIGGLLDAAVRPMKMAYMGLPTVQQSFDYEYNRNRAAFAGMGGSAGNPDDQQTVIRNMGTNLGMKGVQTSATDVIEALNSSRSLGTNIPGIGNSLATASNLTPGIGFTGAASALTGLNAARNVNYLKVLGVNIRDASTGTMRELKLIIEDLWSTLNKQKRGGSAITKHDIHMSLQPGNALDSLLEQYFGNDPMTRKIIEDGLLAKASGVVDLGNQEQLSAAGVIPDGIKSKAKRDNASGNMIGQFTDSIIQGMEIANGMSRGLSNLMVKISNIEGIKQLAYLFAGSKGFADTLVGVGNGAGADLLDMITGIPLTGLAEGGPAGARNTYIVGEKGPELFVPHGGSGQKMIGVNGPEFFAPDQDGTVIPNDKLNFAGFMHKGGIATKKWPDGSETHDNVDNNKGKPTRHMHQENYKLTTDWGTFTDGTQMEKEGPKGLRALLRKAGWKTDEDIENGIAIISKESGRKPINDNLMDADMSYGLFQINMKNDNEGSNRGMGDRRRASYAKYGVKNDWDLYDPLINAKIAWDISVQGRKYWHAWSTAKAAGLDGRKSGHPRTDDPWYDKPQGKLFNAGQGIARVAGAVVDKVGDVAGDVFNAVTTKGPLGSIRGIVGKLKNSLSAADFARLVQELAGGLESDVIGARAGGGPVSASGASGNGGYNINYGGITIKVEGSANWDENKLASEIKKALDYDNLIRRAVSH
jgi:hypothetical protein